MASAKPKPELKGDNHYVPRSYLKRWADAKNGVSCYRILVSHENVPLWEQRSVRSVARHKHLYTRLVAGRECDDIERWLDNDFECPAAESLVKATSNSRLAPDDWHKLIRFLAAQDVRTPARLLESIKLWDETLPALIDETLEDSVAAFEMALSEGRRLEKSDHSVDEHFPGRVVVESSPDGEGGLLGYESVVGRSLWLWSLKHLLMSTSNALLVHKWTILMSPPGVEWLTSDNPVIRLNFHNHQKYDFGGGWSSPGTEIIMPLSPRHLMYTRIGDKPPLRGTVLEKEKALLFQRLISEHAHRYVFSRVPLKEVPTWRPRVVSAEAFKHESDQWKQWHQAQGDAERRLARPAGP